MKRVRQWLIKLLARNDLVFLNLHKMGIESRHSIIVLLAGNDPIALNLHILGRIDLSSKRNGLMYNCYIDGRVE